jgi:hypothetical protein
MFEDLNTWAIVVSAIVSMVIGTFWYSPMTAIGRSWMRLTGVSQSKPQGAEMLKVISAGFLTAITFSTVLAIMLRIANATSVYDGVVIGTIIWVGFIVTNYLGGVIWEKKPFSLFLIYVGYEAVRMVAVASILVLWQ